MAENLREHAARALLVKVGLTANCPACQRQMEWSLSDRFRCQAGHASFWEALRQACFPAGVREVTLMRISCDGRDVATLVRGKIRCGNSGWDDNLLIWNIYGPGLVDEPAEVAAHEFELWVNPKLAEAIGTMRRC